MYEYLSSSFQQWLAEDLGDGDHTSLSCIPAEAVGRSRLIVKESGIIAGVGVAHALFQFVDSSMQFFEYIHDGTEVKPGDSVFEVTGKVHSLLKTERLMLNIMQRMSGIATTTHRYVKTLEGTRTHVLDTRKTTPGMRLLEKEAVRLGGGMNHQPLSGLV